MAADASRLSRFLGSDLVYAFRRSPVAMAVTIMTMPC